VNKTSSSFSVQWNHRIFFTSDAFDKSSPLNAAIEELSPLKILAVIDKGIAEANSEYIDKFLNWCNSNELVVPKPLLVRGGEETKNDLKSVEEVIERVQTDRICRKSCILVLGGGAVLDAVGFAASIAHRGIPLIRMPSTTLSQGDSGVGVKNGVNYFGKKNFIGVFDPPFAVINDVTLLSSLENIHWRSGLSEAIKVALVKDRKLFDFIEEHAGALNERSIKEMQYALEQSALLHLNHITQGGDPFEKKLARPLDFGHWAAHKLEQLSNYQLSHGDAVAIGLCIDVQCSVVLGHLDQSVAKRIITLLKKLGFPIYHQLCEQPELIEGIQEFREHLGGKLTLLMLKGIESTFDIHVLEPAVVRQAIANLR